MLSIHAYPVPASLLDAWTQLLVCEIAPFFLTEALMSRLPNETTLLSRSEFNQMDFALSYRDSYRTYAVHPDASWVAWLRPGEFDSMSSTTQAELLHAQWQLGRGQVYDLDAIRPLLHASGVTASAMSRVVETRDGAKLILDAALWTSLPMPVQRNWLTQFVLEQQAPYDTLDLGAVPWDDVLPHQRASIQALVNRFAPKSGPNCFATTLAATTSRLPTARTISRVWLNQAPFLRGLSARGYHQRPNLQVETHQLRDTVLVWFDPRGTPQHSCYVLSDGIALNKNSQAWYAPRHLVALPDLLTYWSDEPFELVMYRRWS